MNVAAWLLDEQLIKAGVIQRLDLAQVRGQFLRRNIVEHDLEGFVRLEAAHDEIHGAPQGLDRLKIGMVQHGTHGPGKRFVDRRNRGILLRILCGHDVRTDDLFQKALQGRKGSGWDTGVPNKTAEIGKPGIRRDDGATGRAHTCLDRRHRDRACP